MKNKQTLILIIVLILLIILSAVCVGYTIFMNRKENQEVGNKPLLETEEDLPLIVQEKEIEIFKRK